MNFEEACRILGVPITADAEEIHAQYIYKAQLLHPDKTVNLPEKVRNKAEEELKRINEAYNILKDIETSPGNIPPKLNVDPSFVLFKDIPPGEKRTARITINNTGGSFTRFWTDDTPSPWLKVLEVKTVTANPLPLEITLEAFASETLEGKTRCKLPILLENTTNDTRDQVDVVVELQPIRKNPLFPLNIFGPVLKNPFKKDNSLQYSTEKAWMPWLKTALTVFAGYLAGLVFNNISGTSFFIPLITGAVAIFAVDKWLRQFTTRFKLIGVLYKLALNLAVLSLVGLIIWTVVQIFITAGLPSDYSAYVFMLIVELVIFVYIARVFSNNSWRRPKLVPTFFLLAAVVIVLAFAGFEPLEPYKDAVIEFFRSLFDRVITWLDL